MLHYIKILSKKTYYNLQRNNLNSLQSLIIFITFLSLQNLNLTRFAIAAILVAKTVNVTALQLKQKTHNSQFFLF